MENLVYKSNELDEKIIEGVTKMLRVRHKNSGADELEKVGEKNRNQVFRWKSPEIYVIIVDYYTKDDTSQIYKNLIPPVSEKIFIIKQSVILDNPSLFTIYENMKFGKKQEKKKHKIFEQGEWFLDNYFLSDILSYKILPKMTVLGESDVEKIKKVYDIKQFPMIHRDDPVAKYFNLKHDQLVLIEDAYERKYLRTN
jgi:DNA-directed RNA polymerase subunit H (RpoH/RPB5)